MAKLRARSKAKNFKRQSRQSGLIARLATGDAKGRPQHSQSGATIFSKEERQSVQMGIRLELVRIRPQIRHGAGNNTDVTASSAPRKITDS
jgi:hypothetical protein